MRRGGIGVGRWIRVVVLMTRGTKIEGMRKENRGVCFEQGIYGFISIRGEVDECLGEKKDKIGYSVS